MTHPEELPLGLVADIGGTNVRFALAEAADGTITEPRSYRTASFATLTDAVAHYLDEVRTARRPRLGVFAVAGIVRGDEIGITNGEWRFSPSDLERTLGFERFHAVNDFAALGWALPSLQDRDVVPFGWEGRRPDTHTGSFALLGPGTGLGVSAVYARPDGLLVQATEGGHVAFAPGTPEEVDVLRWLQERFGRVSYERLLSGQGLSNLYSALSALHGARVDELSPEQVTARAADGGDPLARHAVRMFSGLLGAFAGDAVLMLGAWDGVYLAGGLVTALFDLLDREVFRARFEDKGRFASTLAQVPTVAIVQPNVGLLGAAAVLRSRYRAGRAGS